MDAITSLAMIPVVGVAATWLAWRLHVPSILLLLGAGLLLGPVLGWLDPDQLFGNILTPMVALAVGLILFEGGLSLTGAELASGGRVVPLLLSVGVGITFGCAALLALTVLGLPGAVSSVLAAVLVVTGPTVVGPLLATIRPSGPVGPVLKAEGILVDPIGAVLASLVFEAAFVAADENRFSQVLGGLAVFALVGLVVGLAGAAVAIVVLRRYLVPDSLTTALGIAMAFGAFAAANALVEESGLLAVTIMGIAIGTQRRWEVRQLLGFNETVRVLLIASLFVVLGARITTAELEAIRWQTFVFAAALIVVVRPLAAAVCTIGSALDRRARVFAAWMAPRGIVAAAVASVFALRLQDAGEAASVELVPAVFLTVVLTIAVYGLTGGPLARKLGLSEPSPQGVLILGAGHLAVELGRALQGEGVRVLLADTDPDNVAAATAAGLEVHRGSVLSEDALTDLDLHGIGRLLTATSNAEAAALAAMLYAALFGRAEIYEVPILRQQRGHQLVDKELHARPLATRGLGFMDLTEQLDRGGAVRVDGVTERKPLAGDPNRLPLFCIHANGRMEVAADDRLFQAGPGDRVVSFVLVP